VIVPSLRRASVIAVAASMLLLAGCTAAPPVASPTTAPTPRPTVTASPESSPQSRFDVDCEALIDEDAVAATFDVTGALTDWRPPLGGIATTFTTRGDFAVLQAGALLCEWGVADSADPSLVVQVLPASADLTGLGDAILSSPVGPGARESCGQRDDLIGCALWVPVATGTVVVAVASPATTDALESFTQDARTLASQVAAVVAASPVAPLWVPAEAPLAAPASCSGLIEDGSRLAALGTLTGDAALSSIVDPLARGALAEVGGLACTWSGEQGLLEIVMLPGGAWAWDEFAPRTTDAIEFTPRDGLGDEAVTAVGHGEALVDVLAGGTWLSIRGDTDDVEQLVEVARAVLAGVGWVQ
jgi:hypothetical protein